MALALNNAIKTKFFSHIHLEVQLHYKDGMRSSYNEVIFAADDFYDQSGPSIETSIEEMCG